MKKTLFFFSILFIFCASSNIAEAQSSVTELNSKEYPAYIIITTENTKLLGGINITIDYKRSKYKEQLSTLEDVLQLQRNMRIRNQTDLLNAMYDFGYEYVNAFNARADTYGASVGDELEGNASDSKFRVNMVFKKMSRE